MGRGHVRLSDRETDSGCTDPEQDLHLRESHVARGWSCRAPPFLACEVDCPEICLDIGVMSSDGKDERRTPKHELQ